ncbi:DUF6508 domain-containing protein (plasmid) [Enterobacter sp. JS8-1]|uniref:DUF6508 domain-containing protein n=1 Tax=Enterobacter sp. JS8-1 TaxID=3411633 RepID=UPI003BA0A838
MSFLKDQVCLLKSSIPQRQKEIEKFLIIFYHSEVLIKFDWMGEISKGSLDLNEFDKCNNEIQLRKILTAHIRLDRFNEGHLLHVCRNGEMYKIISKLESLI